MSRLAVPGAQLWAGDVPKPQLGMSRSASLPPSEAANNLMKITKEATGLSLGKEILPGKRSCAKAAFVRRGGLEPSALPCILGGKHGIFIEKRSFTVRAQVPQGRAALEETAPSPAEQDGINSPFLLGSATGDAAGCPGLIRGDKLEMKRVRVLVTFHRVMSRIYIPVPSLQTGDINATRPVGTETARFAAAGVSRPGSRRGAALNEIKPISTSAAGAPAGTELFESTGARDVACAWRSCGSGREEAEVPHLPLELRGGSAPSGRSGGQKALGPTSDGSANLISRKRIFAKRGSSCRSWGADGRSRRLGWCPPYPKVSQ